MSITSAAHRALKMIDFSAVHHIDSIDVDETLKRGFRSKNDHMAGSLSCYWAFSLSAKATASLFIWCRLLIGSQVFIFPMFSACVSLLVHRLQLKNGCLSKCILTYLCICLYISEQRAIGLIIAVFVGACSPQSKPTAEIVSHGDMELQFLGVGDSAFSPCRSVTQGKCIPPPSFPPPFLFPSLPGSSSLYPSIFSSFPPICLFYLFQLPLCSFFSLFYFP